jgi:oligopeptidase B
MDHPTHEPAAPIPERRPHALRAHGDERTDDWYWLVDRADPAVRAHLEAENAHTEAALAHLASLREALYEEMRSRIVETDLSVPVQKGGWWYFDRTEEGKSYPVHCRRPVLDPDEAPPVDAADPEAEQVLLDENELAGDDEYLHVANRVVSPDASWLAYATDTSGAERYGLRFKRIGRAAGGDHHAEGQEPSATEVVPDTYYGLAWANDNRTVFYTRVDEAMRPYQVWRHPLGDDPALDVLVFEEHDARFTVQPARTKSGRLIVIAVHSTTSSEAWIIPADSPTDPPRVVEPRREDVEYAVEHLHRPASDHDRLLIVTNDDAEDFRLMAADVERPGRAGWLEVVPHRPGTRLEDVDAFEEWIVIHERLEGEPRLRVTPLVVDPTDPGSTDPGSTDPGSTDPLADLLERSWLVETAEHPSTTWQGPNPEPASRLLRVEQTSLVTPRTVFDINLASKTAHLRKRQPVRGYDPSRYRTFRLWADAEDGTRVPISMVHRSDLFQHADGALSADPSVADASAYGPIAGEPAPCLLYGYGAYEMSIDPVFSSFRLSLLDRGFAFAIAHVRGGGELGRRWYEGGKLLHKPHTFTDFVSCARHLIDRGFTAPSLLAARGGSAGGLLIGAVANTAPELFRAVVAEVPFVDALTTMLDESLPLTVGEWEEWGNPVADPEAYAVMRSYSPYDNVRATDGTGAPLRYPDVLATAGLNDNRVGYWEPAKWVAKLRDANPANRVLLRTELGAGHGGPSGRYDAWRDEALVVAFLLDALGVSSVSGSVT